MEKLSISIDREMDIMARWSLTADEWMLTRLLMLAQDPENRPQYLKRYLTECAKTNLTREVLISLQNKKVIDKSYKVPKTGEKFSVDDLEFTEMFRKSHFKLSAEAGLELFDAYPAHMYGQGGKILNIRNITKGGYADLESFSFAYSKAIKHDPKLHREVLESLEYAKEHDMVQYGIVEYIASQKWREHMQMMKDGGIGGFTVKLDNVNLI